MKGFLWDDLRKIFTQRSRRAKVPHGAETLPKISIAWLGCTNVTDRQTNDRQTDGRWHIANMNFLSSRSLKIAKTTFFWLHYYRRKYWCIFNHFLANVNSRSRSLYVVVRPSVACRLSSVCRLSVTFVCPTQAIEIFGNIWHLVRWPSMTFR